MAHQLTSSRRKCEGCRTAWTRPTRTSWMGQSGRRRGAGSLTSGALGNWRCRPPSSATCRRAKSTMRPEWSFSDWPRMRTRCGWLGPRLRRGSSWTCHNLTAPSMAWA